MQRRPGYPKAKESHDPERRILRIIKIVKREVL